MSNAAIFHSRPDFQGHESGAMPTGSDNVCGDKLAGPEYSALAVCAGCGRRFVPDGPQRYCDSTCYHDVLRVPLADRFWTKVNKTAGCWLWTAATIRGYGQISLNRKPAYAHRVSWELANGPIPNGLAVLHRCDVPLCVRPDHLFLGTLADNLTDARMKGRLDERRPRRVTLTYADRLAIFRAKRYRGICVEFARQYGVTKACISQIRKGRFAHPPTFPRTIARPPAQRPDNSFVKGCA